jgi:hypothetical protein
MVCNECLPDLKTARRGDLNPDTPPWKPENKPQDRFQPPPQITRQLPETLNIDNF